MKQAIEQVALELIDFVPQARKRFGEEALGSLRQSIAAIGVQQPVQLQPGGKGRYTVIDGEQRCRSALVVGHTTVPAIIITDKLEAAALLERQLVLNTVRYDLSPLEIARGIDTLIRESGRTASDVAASLGMSNPTVSRLLALLTLPPEIQARIEEGQIRASVAAELARVPNPELQRTLADEVAAGSLTREGVIDRVRRRAPRPAATNGQCGPAGKGRVTAALGGGRLITLVGPGLASLDDLVSWLTELAAEARKVKNQKLALATFARMLRDRAKTEKPEGGDALLP